MADRLDSGEEGNDVAEAAATDDSGLDVTCSMENKLCLPATVVMVAVDDNFTVGGSEERRVFVCSLSRNGAAPRGSSENMKRPERLNHGRASIEVFGVMSHPKKRGRPEQCETARGLIRL